MDRGPTSIGASLLPLAGVGGAALGVWLPWLRVEPGYRGPVPSIYVSGMEAGIAGRDYPILGLVGIGVIASLVLSAKYRRGLLAGLVAATTGILLVLSTLWWVVETPGGDGVYLGVYVIGAGVYVTACGGVLLTVSGCLQLAIHGNGTPGRTANGS